MLDSFHPLPLSPTNIPTPSPSPLDAALAVEWLQLFDTTAEHKEDLSIGRLDVMVRSADKRLFAKVVHRTRIPLGRNASLTKRLCDFCCGNVRLIDSSVSQLVIH